MAFQTKSFVSIVASMINRMRRTTSLITDYNPGSVARTLVEAPAQEIDQLYQEMIAGLVEGIQASVYRTFNFAALNATPTSGLIRTTITSSAAALTIAAGTTATETLGGGVYTVTADTVIAAGATFADVPVSAAVAGSAGNLPEGSSFTFSPAPAGFVSATNLTAWVNGTDAETPSQRLIRFNAFVQTLSRATVDAVEYGALTAYVTDAAGNVIERVLTAKVVEPFKSDPTQPPSLLKVYVHNGVGGTSAALVAQAQSVIYGYYDAAGNRVPGWSAAGVHVEVFAATDQYVPVIGTLTIVPPSGTSLAETEAAAIAAIDNYLTALPEGVSYLASQVAALMIGLPAIGTTNWVPHTPTVDVAAAANVKLLPGAVVVITLPIVATCASTSTMIGTLS